MLTIRLSGRFGNYLFQIAAGATLAHQLGEEFQVLVAPDDEAIAQGESDTMWNYLQKFHQTIFSQVTFIREAPKGVPMYSWRDFPYKSIPYVQGQNLIIDGYYQSYKYLSDEVYIRQLYAMPTSIREKLHAHYGQLIDGAFICLHVRRGDYLRLPHRFSVCSADYYYKALELIGGDLPVLIISDDLPWCRKHLRGSRIHYADLSTSMLEDFYLQTLATHNIISNSSFSWWGAWLNPHPEKIVIYPTPWFGPHSRHYDTCDLCPPEWIALPNRTPLRYRLKADWIRGVMKIGRIFSNKNHSFF